MGSEYEYVAEEKLQLHNTNNKNIFHVLAVDDSNIDRKLLERLLTLSQYQVTCVDSGDKALEYLHLQYQTPPSQSSSNSTSTKQQQQVSKVNLIMTDYSMPGINGYDLLKIIKEDSSWKDVPVIVMSSENVPSRINMCLEGGAEEFLLKPVKLSDLTKLQSHILKHRDCGRETTIDSEEKKVTVATNNGNDEKGKTITITTTNEINNINIDETLTTILMSSDRRPRVQELPVA